MTTKRGTHGLRKRCPWCKKLRRFHGVGPDGRFAREARWTKVAGRWVCKRCVQKVLEAMP